MYAKKGQVSLEILIILGILVVGAVVFSIIFITNVRQSSNVDETTDMDSFVDDFKKDLNVRTAEPNNIDDPFRKIIFFEEKINNY